MLQAVLLSFMLPIHMPAGGGNIGSSALIAPRLVLTAAHVIKGPVMDVLCMGERIPAVVVRQDVGQDLALLYLTHACAITPVALANQNIAVGSAVTAIGCPDGNCGWQAKGHVMGYMALALKGMPERPVLVSDAPVYFGNSGGPLVNERGHLVGVCSQIFKFGSDDGWAPTFGAFVPIEAILEFLGRDDEPSLVAP